LGILGESSENITRYFQEYGNGIIGESLGIIRPGLDRRSPPAAAAASYQWHLRG